MLSIGDDKPDFPFFDLSFSRCQTVVLRIVMLSRTLCLSFAAAIIKVSAPFFRRSLF